MLWKKNSSDLLTDVADFTFHSTATENIISIALVLFPDYSFLFSLSSF